MRTLITLVILTSLFRCSDSKTNNLGLKNNEIRENANPFIVSAVDAKFPLRLDEIDLEEQTTTIQLNDGIVSRIEETIKEYAEDITFYDSSQTYRDAYINTIRLRDSLQTIYFVLLKKHPIDEVNSRVLFYNNQSKEFTKATIDFKIYGLYDFDNGKLIPTKLKGNFKITSPEIEIIDFNKDGINDYKFVRLWHNGTFNSIHTAILTVKKSTVDTLYVCEKAIGELADKKNCL